MVIKLKILFISDIHGICNNLEYIDKVIQTEKINKLVVLGDLYYCDQVYINDDKYNYNKAIVGQFLSKYRNIIICTRGNCDSDLEVKISNFPICSSLGIIYVDNIPIYITHGNEYNKYNNTKITNSVLVYGHEHIPYIENNNNMLYINVGSISLPRNNNKPTYMIYQNKEFTIYDIDNNIINKCKIETN